MRRKSVIFFILFFLIFSFGGAIAYHHLRKDEHPTFTEVDAFLRGMPVPEGWRYDRRATGSPFLFHKENVWHRLGISREIPYEQENFIYIHDVTRMEANLCIWHTGGRVHRITFGVPPADPKVFLFYQDSFSKKYPTISNNGHEFAGTFDHH
jgi:hypothetical protein